MTLLMRDYHVAIKMLKEAEDRASTAEDHARRAADLITGALGRLQKDRRRVRKRLLMCMIDKPPICPPEPPDDDDYVTRTAVEKAVAVASSQWTYPVEEPGGPGWEQIDGYIRGAMGLDWYSADASNLGEPIPYTENGQFAWCGAFQAWCWGHAKLSRDIRYNHMASLYRIYSWAKGSKRVVAPEDIQRGDVVCMGPLDGPKYGQHMAMAITSTNEGQIVCLEGNAHGEGPHGRYYEGVTQNLRPVAGINVLGGDNEAKYYVLYGVRFLVGDLDND